jgi:hypothetical protein
VHASRNGLSQTVVRRCQRVAYGPFLAVTSMTPGPRRATPRGAPPRYQRNSHVRSNYSGGLREGRLTSTNPTTHRLSSPGLAAARGRARPDEMTQRANAGSSSV